MNLSSKFIHLILIEYLCSVDSRCQRSVRQSLLSRNLKSHLKQDKHRWNIISNIIKSSKCFRNSQKSSDKYGLELMGKSS